MIKFKWSNSILITWKTYIFLLISGVKEIYNLGESYVVTPGFIQAILLMSVFKVRCRWGSQGAVSFTRDS